MSGPNDLAMQGPRNSVSDGFNSLVNRGMDQLGYNTRHRKPEEDNPFYRDQAQYMPGWSMPGSGLPSGAYAQERATNYVGHPNGVLRHDTIWRDVRTGLVAEEGARIRERQAHGESGRLSFGDLYRAHEHAYDHSGGHNSFVDPASFALAVYGAPALERAGIHSGPITGSSIDLFNDPTDSATAGWGKRMGLSAAEIGTGLGALATGNPLVGAGLIGLGGFSGLWNTGTAISHGMLGEIGGNVGRGASNVYHGAGRALSHAGTAIHNGAASTMSATGRLAAAAGHRISGAWHQMWRD